MLRSDEDDYDESDSAVLTPPSTKSGSIEETGKGSRAKKNYVVTGATYPEPTSMSTNNAARSNAARFSSPPFASASPDRRAALQEHLRMLEREIISTMRYGMEDVEKVQEEPSSHCSTVAIQGNDSIKNFTYINEATDELSTIQQTISMLSARVDQLVNTMKR